MLDKILLDKILFLDIETVPAAPDYHSLPQQMQALWNKKAKLIGKPEELPEEVYEKAGIYAEFGKIVCISVGLFRPKEKTIEFRVKSFYGNDEKEILNSFFSLLHKHFNTPYHFLCAHNGKEFDFPYICRRAIINSIPLPSILNIAGKKPWEVQHLDTMELWKFGDYKNFTSLELLTAILDIPSPKDQMDGSEVKIYYWIKNDIESIVTYCQKDVIAIAQVLLRYRREALLDENQILYT
ncbi:MAG: 3'-5' exonuclease [Flavobacteriales bacterium]|nr:3'-5' exonuclease [Flavobacteriales bacterium]